MRSFDIEEADENDDDDHQNSRKKKKKRKKGLGFGGGENMMDLDEDAPKDDEVGSSTTNTYGKEALEKLKLEKATHQLRILNYGW